MQKEDSDVKCNVKCNEQRRRLCIFDRRNEYAESQCKQGQDIETDTSFCGYNNYTFHMTLDGPLHRLSQVVVNTLDLQVALQARRTQFSTDSAHLESTKGHASVQHAILVAPDSACNQGACDSDGLFGVVGMHGGSETKSRVVG